MMTLRSSIHPKLMWRVLVKGSILAGVGVLLLLLTGMFLPLEEMKQWGPIIFILGLGCVTFGLLPYKRLKKLEVNPYILRLDENDLYFFINETSIFMIPLVSIDTIQYIEKKESYGIGILLKSPLPQKLVVQDPRFNLSAFRKKSNKQGSDLFFEYFSQRSYETLSEAIKHDETSTSE
jgi:hypothetical protein